MTSLADQGTVAAKARRLPDLHTSPEILVLANVWGVVSAKVVAAIPGTPPLRSPPAACYRRARGR